jgi:hypothetical protein
MGEATSTTFTILLFVVAFLGAGAYAVLSIADFRAARRGFWATAVSFAAIGLVLGLMTTWPLPVRITVAAAFGAVAIGSLTWVLDYLKTREGLGNSEATNQPDIILLPPVHAYKVSWNATSNMEMTILPVRRADETESLKTAAPIFQIKNIGTVLAKSITIDWDTKAINVKAAANDSERLKNFSVKFTDTHFGIFSKGTADSKAIEVMIGLRGISSNPKGYWGVYSQLMTTKIPYMAPEINNTAYQDAALPPQVTELLSLYVVATIVDRPRSAPSWAALPPLFATIRWQSPENGKPVRYEINSRVLNLKSRAIINNMVVGENANVEAELEFTVSPAP